MAILSAQHFLLQKLAEQKESLQTYDFNGRKVWIKKAGQQNAIWLYRIIGFILRTLDMETLKPIPNVGGNKAIMNEIQRLKTLADHNISVPSVLAYTPQGFMMTDLGSSVCPARQLDATLSRCQDANLCLSYFKLAVDAISEVHYKQLWLSEALAKNMVLDENDHIGFIEFALTPDEFLTAPLCFARDWLYFIFSISIRIQQQQLIPQATQYLQQKLQLESATTQRAIYNTYKRLSWLRYIPLHQFGRDGQRLDAMADILYHLSELQSQQ